VFFHQVEGCYTIFFGKEVAVLYRFFVVFEEEFYVNVFEVATHTHSLSSIRMQEKKMHYNVLCVTYLNR